MARSKKSPQSKSRPSKPSKDNADLASSTALVGASDAAEAQDAPPHPLASLVEELLKQVSIAHHYYVGGVPTTYVHDDDDGPASEESARWALRDSLHLVGQLMLRQTNHAQDLQSPEPAATLAVLAGLAEAVAPVDEATVPNGTPRIINGALLVAELALAIAVEVARGKTSRARRNRYALNVGVALRAIRGNYKADTDNLTVTSAKGEVVSMCKSFLVDGRSDYLDADSDEARARMVALTKHYLEIVLQRDSREDDRSTLVRVLSSKRGSIYQHVSDVLGSMFGVAMTQDAVEATIGRSQERLIR